MLQGNTVKYTIGIYTESRDFTTKQFGVDLSILLHFVIVTFHANAAGLLILRDIISPI